MKKCFAIVLTLLFAAANILSQDTGASPKPTPPDDDVVKISTNLIQIDVSVTDAKGKPITDIRPEEVEIYENGEKQTISNFSFVSSHTERSVKPAVIDKTGVPIPQGTLRPEQIRRTIALVVDDLSLSFESAYQTRRGLKKFVDEQMQDGDLVAIIRTGAGIGALQQFTSDKRILYAAIEKVKWNPQGGGGISAFAPIESAPDTSLQTSGDDGSTDEVPAAGGSGQSLDDFRTQGFVTGTLGALRYIVTGMGELPGRKSVILFSDGFRILETDESGISTTGVVLDFMRALIDQANRSSVVFYTIDARGLVFT
ncbi:MAG: VWA domain-containing protein, partial [Pyrinomonadaceae bacterium]|nr:VWA domain-containing protein [Pyrinomonadaceae bacterium]